jgi:hypothetical protein
MEVLKTRRDSSGEPQVHFMLLSRIRCTHARLSLPPVLHQITTVTQRSKLSPMFSVPISALSSHVGYYVCALCVMMMMMMMMMMMSSLTCTL